MIPYSEQVSSQGTEFHKNPVEKELDYFYSHAYHDMRFFLNSITQSDSNSAVYFADMQKDLFYITDNLKKTFGFHGHLVQDFFRHWRKRLHGERWVAVFDDTLERIYTDKLERIDLRQQVEDKFGTVLWVRFYGAIQWDKDKTKPLFFAGRISRQDEDFAIDPTTNFPTIRTLQKFIGSCDPDKFRFTSIGFSYNYMPQINSKYGRTLADQLIGKASQHLMDAFGEDISFYRLPGVRCLALLNQGGDEDARSIIEKIQVIIQQEYQNMGILVPKACSFAVMHFPHKGLDPEYFQETMVSLLKMARREPNTPYIVDSEQNIERVHQISVMDIVLRKDVMCHMQNFRAVIQPIVDTFTGRIVGGETLLRWKYKGKDVSPSVFIPILESDDMIHIAGRWVMEQAIKALSRIIKSIPDFYLSVNISLNQLHDPMLEEFIPKTLLKYGVEGRHLVVETTESCMDTEPALIHRLIDTCHSYGIRIALDDFGTGYSSLRVLLQYHTDIVKLDRSLLLEMAESVDKTNFIASIVFACHRFGRIVCMEGVETAEHHALVQEADGDTIQGFYFYKPTEISEVYRIAEEQK